MTVADDLVVLDKTKGSKQDNQISDYGHIVSIKQKDLNRISKSATTVI
jgi:hypothetical protein